MFSIRFFLPVAIGMICLSLGGCNPKEKPAITIQVGEWDTIGIANNVFKIVVEEGYGYPVQFVEQNEHWIEWGFASGQIDLKLEVWPGVWPPWFSEEIEKGNILNVGPMYETSCQFWVIPKWVADQYQIRTVADMKAHWQLFENPKNPDRGLYINGIYDWEITFINEAKFHAYGLDQYYDILEPGSSTVLDGLLIRAQEEHRPIFAMYWEPSSLLGMYEWQVLEEPPFSQECWNRLKASAQQEPPLPVDSACATPANSVDKVIRRGFLKKAPEVVDMLRRMQIGSHPMNECAGWARRHKATWEQAAVYYLETYEDSWKSWVPPDVYERVRSGLNTRQGDRY
jgi:glycine betaine/proline transport system substrate-binding protein